MAPGWYDEAMRHHRSTALAVTGLLTAAATMFAAPSAEAASGYTTVVQWEGGKTKACRVDDPATGTSRVKVFWDGRAYVNDREFKKNGSGGLARVNDNFTLSGHTYSTADAGRIGPVVSKVLATDGFVYVLAGSQVGICKERIMPVLSVNPC